MADYVWVDKRVPPDYQKILAESMSEGEMWYEIRCSHRLMALTADQYDSAVMAGKRLNKIFPSSELYYVWRSRKGIEEIKIY